MALLRKKSRYQIDLNALERLCAANYIRVSRLFPTMQHQTHRSIQLVGGDVCLEVSHRGSYSTQLLMSQTFKVLPIADPPSCAVIVYHDVRLAEVRRWDGVRIRQPRYQYPNSQMLQENEKWQINAFWGQWLDYCFACGVIEGTKLENCFDY